MPSQPLPPPLPPLQTSERAAGELEGAYGALLELERRSQGRVMSRPVSACTRVLAPLQLQDWEVGGGARRGGAVKPCCRAAGKRLLRAAQRPCSP